MELNQGMGAVQPREPGRIKGITIKKSIFHVSAGIVHSVEEALDFLARVREDFPGATHHAHAFRIGCPVRWEDSSDDGEPRGTAGRPIMTIMRRARLTNACIVVSRFFGGKKLGTGGLMKAYGECASKIIQAIGVVPVE